MLIPFSSVSEIPDCDVCVVGAEPVGIGLALACEGHGLSVLVIESGQEQPDRFAVALALRLATHLAGQSRRSNLEAAA
jgi:2-polyprenyl-6-methoxyphenol hydroxylase-like FAD-dependent oxidoreductase